MKQSKLKMRMFTFVAFVLATFAASSVYAASCETTIKKEFDGVLGNYSYNRIGLVMTSFGLPGSGYNPQSGRAIPRVGYLDISSLTTAGPYPNRLNGKGDLLFNDREFNHYGPCGELGCFDYDAHPFTPHGPDPVKISLSYQTSTLTLLHNGVKRTVKLDCDGSGLMTGKDIRFSPGVPWVGRGQGFHYGSGEYILSFYRWKHEVPK